MNTNQTIALVITAIASTILALLVGWIGGWGPTVHLFRLMVKLQRLADAKKLVPPTSQPVTDPWPEPPHDLFRNETRILWGYWKTGEQNMPGFCQYAVETWKARNPAWHVIILSDENYQKYVSVNDLPTTYQSLKAQTLSDIIPIAAMVRYGGAYLDVSTVVWKGLDGIWNSMPPESLMLTAPVTLSNSKVLYNLALIFAPASGNRVLKEWLRRAIAYFENPAITKKQVLRHPEFRGVSKMMQDPNLGVCAKLLPYSATVWILTDIIMHNETLQGYLVEHLHVLPTMRWTFDIIALAHLPTNNNDMATEDTYGDPSLDPAFPGFKAPALFQSAVRMLQLEFRDEADRARALVHKLAVMKTSSDGSLWFHEPKSYHTSQNTTLSRIYRMALNTEEYPTVQATMAGAKRYCRGNPPGNC